MKIIISALLWAAGLIHGVLAFVVAITALAIFPPKKAYPLLQWLAKTQLAVMGVRLKVEGQKKIDPDKSWFLMGNHESLFDVFIIPATVPFFFVGVEAASHFSWPIWGYLIKKWGNIPIPRYKKTQAFSALKKAKEILDSGASLIILPEGHRTLTGEVGEFKKGPFHLALTAKADILPFAMSGAYQYKNKHSWMLTPGEITVRFGDPIPHESFNKMSVEALGDHVRHRIMRLKRAGEKPLH